MTTKRKLIAAIDTGSSATKFVYQWQGQSPQFEIMSPWCAEVSEAIAKSKAELSGSELPHLESSWVSDIDGFYLLGLSAERYFGSGFETGERKFKKALYKILGVLGYLVATADAEVEVALGIVLPYSEYATKRQLEQELRASLQTGFQYCDRPVNICLQSLAIRPEGAGVYLFGVDGINKRRPIASLVIGQRNCSWLTAIDGTPIEKYCNTNDLGFRWIVEEVSSRTGFTDEMMLTEMIFKGKNMPSDVEQVLPQLFSQYWSQLSSWLDRRIEVCYIVASGGTSLKLKKLLTKKYKKKIGWADSLADEVVACGVEDPVMVHRFTDCYGVLKAIGGGVVVEVAA